MTNKMVFYTIALAFLKIPEDSLLETMTSMLASNSPLFIAVTMGTRSVPLVDPKTASFNSTTPSFF